jgi:hypothetical protein
MARMISLEIGAAPAHGVGIVGRIRLAGFALLPAEQWGPFLAQLRGWAVMISVCLPVARS